MLFRLYFISSTFLCFLLVFDVVTSSSLSWLLNKSPSDMLQLVRVKRQAGYFYNKPSVAFDLPTRPTTTAYQTPSSVDFQKQQMYYAYPVSAGGSSAGTGGGVVNIGFSTASSTIGSTTDVTQASIGYNYVSQESSLSSDSSSTNRPSQATASTSGITGYGYNMPTQSTLSSQKQLNEQSVSTNAPTYLPPKSTSSSQTQQESNISTLGSTTTNPISITDTYLPPSINSASVSSQLITATQENTSASIDTGYIPPKSPTSGPPLSTSSTSAPGYLPPMSFSPTQGTVSTPAPTYLPPLLK